MDEAVVEAVLEGAASLLGDLLEAGLEIGSAASKPPGERSEVKPEIQLDRL